MRVDPQFEKKTKNLACPFVVYDLEKIKKNIDKIQAAFTGVGVFYAMKCNPHERILKKIFETGVGFEVASYSEVEKLLKLGVSPEKIMCLHPIKSESFIKYLAKVGVTVLAADSFEEVDKISVLAPGSKILIRISVDNHGSRFSLDGKFGLKKESFITLCQYIKKKNLTPHGLTFHVGSQCESLKTWIGALKVCASVWNETYKSGIDLKLLSLGGGIATSYNRIIPDVSNIGSSIIKYIKSNFKGDFITTIEPGRAVVADTAILVTEIFGLAKRGRLNWAYADVGVFNYLHEILELNDHNYYPIKVSNSSDGALVKYHIGGPTCVSFDTIYKNIKIPELKVNDRLYIQNVGAYSEPCSAPFNGFFPPKVYFAQDIE